MKEKITELLKGKKIDRIIFIAGIIGIVLIFSSTFFPKKEKSEEENVSAVSFSAEEYCEIVEGKVKDLVAGIAGDTAPVVSVTLETGINYIYADETKQNTQNESDRTSEETEQTYKVVTQADGTEKPLILTEQMPRIRGIAIVCRANSPTDQEEIKSAVMAAFDLTSKRVYIAGRTNAQ